jgi:hypothetical protein
MDPRKNPKNKIIPPNTVELSLDQLALAINQEHENCQKAYRSALIHARSALSHAHQTGKFLLQAKKKLPHGRWLPWLVANCSDISERTAQVYMRIARRWHELEELTPIVADLSLDEACKILATRKQLPASAIESERVHTRTQWVLAKLGKKLCKQGDRDGCVWIARNDRSESWEGEKLGDLSVDELPPLGGIGNPAAQEIVHYIDVLWLSGDNCIVAAFEVERTTSIYSGLLRMADLIALCPNLNINLYLVVPNLRVEEVKKQLLRPTFKALKLDQKCRWIIIEELIQKWDVLMEYATETTIINQLAHSLVN